MSQYSAGAAFRKAMQEESPLQVVGAINANHALLAKRAGFKAIYLSGGGVAAGSLGLPDLGISNLDDVLTDVRRITDVCDLPLLVDVDTGFGGIFNIARLVRGLIKDGAAAMHIEDQVALKRALGVLNERERIIFEERRLKDDPITLEELAAGDGAAGGFDSEGKGNDVEEQPFILRRPIARRKACWKILWKAHRQSRPPVRRTQGRRKRLETCPPRRDSSAHPVRFPSQAAL